ncbi:MAG TPA: CBS domain-containing protein [Pseudonocardia sp.]|jgi:CBS domain-containing protein|nr:CBS domain-containing protein [Pseudonocardia sp.]
MKVESVLRTKGRHVTTIQPWATISDAVDRMHGPPRVGALVVTGVARGFTGIITERDIVRGLKQFGSGLLEHRVSELMAQHVPTCAPADPLNEVMVIMTHSRHRHLPVLVDGELAGLISIGDVVRARLDEMELETGVLRDLYAARH